MKLPRYELEWVCRLLWHYSPTVNLRVFYRGCAFATDCVRSDSRLVLFAIGHVYLCLLRMTRLERRFVLKGKGGKDLLNLFKTLSLKEPRFRKAMRQAARG